MSSSCFSLMSVSRTNTLTSLELFLVAWLFIAARLVRFLDVFQVFPAEVFLWGGRRWGVTVADRGGPRPRIPLRRRPLPPSSPHLGMFRCFLVTPPPQVCSSFRPRLLPVVPHIADCVQPTFAMDDDDKCHRRRIAYINSNNPPPSNNRYRVAPPNENPIPSAVLPAPRHLAILPRIQSNPAQGIVALPLQPTAPRAIVGASSNQRLECIISQ